MNTHLSSLLPPFSALPGLLPLATLSLGIWFVRRVRQDGGLAGAVVRASAIWGVALWLATEALSALGMLRRPALLMLWVTTFAALAVASIRLYRRATVPTVSFRGRWAWSLVPLFVATAFAAVLVPPNTWDTLCYHLSRVEFWLQQGSIAFYPTSVDRQLFSQPFAEIALLHVHALARGDWFDGLLQWSAFLGCVVLVHDLAVSFAGGRRAGAAAAAFAATLPIALAEASTCQNDLVTSFWILASVRSLSRLPSGPWRLTDVLELGACAGLAVLTKGSAYPLLVPVAVAAAIRTFQDTKRRFAAASAALALALVINVPHWTRTALAFGDPFGGQTASFRPPATGSGLAVTVWGGIASNLTPLAPEAVHRTTERLLEAFEIAHDDPTVFWPGCDVTWMPSTMNLLLHQDLAPNPLHTLLLAAAIAAALVAAARHRNRHTASMAALWLGAAAAFVGCVRWQPWITRLQTPLLLAGAVPVGWMAARIPRRVASILCAILILAALPMAFCATNRSLLPAPWTSGCNVRNSPREHLYFADRRDRYRHYAAVADRIAELHPASIALVGDAGSWDYPLFPMLRTRMRGNVPVLHYVPEDGNPTGEEPLLHLSSNGYPFLQEQATPSAQ